MTTDNDSVRAAFEQAMAPFFERLCGMNPDPSTWHKDDDGMYLNPLFEQHFVTWQASRERYVPDPCEWIQDEWDNSYDTSCGNKYEIIDGTPEDNGMNYCTYCGGKLETITGDATRAETQGKHE